MRAPAARRGHIAVASPFRRARVRRVSSACRPLLIWALLAAVFSPVRAQTLIGEFALQGSLNNNVSGGAALVSLGGQITSNGYVFGVNQGLTFTSTALNPTSYTIELSFSTNLDSTQAWSKLVDFAGQSSDNGLYIHNSSGFRLQFFPQSDATVSDFSAGTTFDVVLTRNSTTGVVTGYVDGQFRFSFPDSGSIGVVTATNNTLHFFVDDHIQNTEASSGMLNYLRIYDGALTSSQVATLYAAGAPSAIPEPGASAATLGAAALGLLVLRRSVRR